MSTGSWLSGLGNLIFLNSLGAVLKFAFKIVSNVPMLFSTLTNSSSLVSISEIRSK
jgi:hypothetical protein